VCVCVCVFAVFPSNFFMFHSSFFFRAEELLSNTQRERELGE
jgi:hypothetical protein